MSRVKYSWLRLSGHWWLLPGAGAQHNGADRGELRALHWEWPGPGSSWSSWSLIRGEVETIFIQRSSGPQQPPWQWNINYLLTPYWSSAVFQAMEYDDRHTIILIVILNLKLSALHTCGQTGILITNNEILFGRRRIPALFGLISSQRNPPRLGKVLWLSQYLLKCSW